MSSIGKCGGVKEEGGATPWIHQLVEHPLGNSSLTHSLHRNVFQLEGRNEVKVAKAVGMAFPPITCVWMVYQKGGRGDRPC